MAEKVTHGQLLAAAGQTGAGEVTLGTITLPAGGPWTIHDVFIQVVRATATAGEYNGGFLQLRADSGDVTPNILPSQWAVQESASFLGATADSTICPLHIYPTNLQASGKAVLTLTYTQDTAVTAAPQIVAGVMFGDKIPDPLQRHVHCIRTRAAVTSAADTTVGTITLPETAKRITGIMGTLAQDNVITAGEELIGFWRMTSDDMDILPAQFPFMNVYGAGLGGTINSATNLSNRLLPVDIPIIGGTRLNVFCDLNTAVTNAAEVAVYIAFE